MPSNTDLLRDKFVDFADECEILFAPMYQYFSERVAADGELKSICSVVEKGQPVPNLFFGAIRFHLLSGLTHSLGDIYKKIQNGQPVDYEYAYRQLHSFCLDNAGLIRQTMSEKLVQTNVPARCSYLMPAFSKMCERFNIVNFHVVEIGASAGLNLLWDHYYYDYSDETHGNPLSPVHIKSAFKGESPLAGRSHTYQVASRTGIDLNPINLSDPKDLLWLRSLVWPERIEEEKVLLSAVDYALNSNLYELKKGNAISLLPMLLNDIPPQSNVFLFDTHVMNQFSIDDRAELDRIILAGSKQRDIYRISVGGLSIPAEIRLTVAKSGKTYQILMGYSDAHGLWSEWL
tara:strand:+ start:3050 stop:4087 length:1038 start_codon:yes stop_codon:yes gene_type:complete